MKKKPAKTVTYGFRYEPPNIPMRAIRRFALQIAERFLPDRIILFGSHAYGCPHPESDVDLLVVMPAANEINQAIRITCAFTAPFPLDLIVRTPKSLQRGLEDENWFLREVVSKGKVLYEKGDSPVGAKSGSRPGRRTHSRSAKAQSK
jgi:uncharacterized protein